MKTIELIVKTGNQKYPIIIGNNILNKLQVLLKKKLINYNQCIIIIDKNVPKKLIGRILNSLPEKQKTIHYFTSSEKNKNQKSIDKILSILFKKTLIETIV
jgi:3-dehydroquinate synthase